MGALKIYCEHGALTPALRQLQRNGRITLVYFPYDPDARTPSISPTATPSAAQYRDLNLTYGELQGQYGDFQGSPLFAQIREIIGSQNRRDVLHVDSAYKSKCHAFLTRDNDILNHRDRLESLLGLRILNPDTDNDALLAIVESQAV
jgi:hypothetical protein